MKSGLLPAAIICMAFTAQIFASVAAQPKGDFQAETEIRNSLAAWVEATNKKDEKSANSIWAPNAVGWFPSSPEAGYKAAFDLAGMAFKKDAIYSTYGLKIEEVALSGPIAAVHDIWTEIVHFEGTDVTVKRQIRGSELWRLQSDGKWRIARFVSAPEKWEKTAPRG